MNTNNTSTNEPSWLAPSTRTRAPRTLRAVLNLALALGLLALAPPSAPAATYVAVASSAGIDEYIAVGPTTWVWNRQVSATSVYHMAVSEGQIYASQAGMIYKIDPTTGAATAIVTRGVAPATAWTTGDAQGIEFGPDGYLYFSTAFNGTGSGVYRLDTNGITFSLFIPYTGTGYTLNNARDLAWRGTNLYVSARAGFNATGRPIYQFNSAGAFVQSVATSLQAPQPLFIDGTNLLVGAGNNGVDLRTINLTGPLPTNGTVLATGGQNQLDILRVESAIYTANFNSGAGAVGQVRAYNTNVVATAPAGVTFNGLAILGPATTGPLQSVSLQLRRNQMLADTFQQAAVTANYLLLTNDVSSDPGTTYSSDNPSVVTLSANGKVSALSPGAAKVIAAFGGKSATNTVTVVPLSTALIHRYSFNETDGALSATDSVGGTPQWDAPVYMYPGIVGGVVTNDTSLNPGGFVRIPEGAITNREALTFEAWASFGTNGNWARLFDFGTDNGVGTGSTNTLFVSPRTGVGTTRMSLTTRGVTEFAEVAGTLDNRANVHIVAVFHPLAGYLKLYLNGALAAQNLNVTRDLAGFDDSLNYLGQSQFWASDAYLNGSINEFRIYSGVLAGTNVAINAAAGPDRFVSDPGTLQSVALSASATMLEQGQQTVTLLANFANVTNVNLSTFGPAFTSSDTNVFSVTAAGFVKATGPGTATITTSYGGKSDSKTITVYPLPVAGVLVADQGNNRVLRYDARGTNWTLVDTFAQGSYDGTNLTSPQALAQDHAGNVYVGDNSRILQFSPRGVFLRVLATNGVDYVGVPDGMAVGPDGNLYFSTPFTGAKVIYKVDLATSVVTTAVPTTDGVNYTFNNPRGIAFGGDGLLYVADRGGFSEGNRSIHQFDLATGAWLSDLVTGLNAPNALSYDMLSDRFLASVDSAANLIAVATNGTVSYVLDDTIGHAILDVQNINPNVFFTDFSGGGVWAVTAPNASVLVAGGMVNPGRMLVLPPRLKLALAGGTATLSWASDAVGYSLQVTPSLAPADWQSVMNTPVILGIEKQVTLPVGASANFYRLKK